MQKMMVIALLACAGAVAAQERPVGRTRGGSTGTMLSILDNYEPQIVGMTAAVRRDSFIVSQLAAAVFALDDFQKSVAIQKAADRVDDALKRASEKPPAPQSTLDLLHAVRDAVAHAKQQGFSADLKDVQKLIAKRMEELQRLLFREIDDARRERQTLIDLHTRLQRLTDTIDAAMSEALASTLDSMRAGGK
jgi:hypothetical protein